MWHKSDHVKKKKKTSKISIDSNFTSYARLSALALLHRLLRCIKSCRQDYMQKLFYFSHFIRKWFQPNSLEQMCYFYLKKRGELQIDAINLNFENFESTLYMKPLSKPFLQKFSYLGLMNTFSTESIAAMGRRSSHPRAPEYITALASPGGNG